MVKSLSFLLFLMCCSQIQAQEIVRTYNVPSAQQGVAVDDGFFYVINNSAIIKYDKPNGMKPP